MDRCKPLKLTANPVMEKLFPVKNAKMVGISPDKLLMRKRHSSTLGAARLGSSNARTSMSHYAAMDDKITKTVQKCQFDSYRTNFEKKASFNDLPPVKFAREVPSQPLLANVKGEIGTIGWGVRELRDRSFKKIAMEKPMMRGFDKKRLHQHLYMQDGFSAHLDKKLGFQYSDRFSIRAMREEIFSIMKRAKHGSYTRCEKNQKSPPRPTSEIRMTGTDEPSFGGDRCVKQSNSNYDKMKIYMHNRDTGYGADQLASGDSILHFPSKSVNHNTSDGHYMTHTVNSLQTEVKAVPKCGHARKIEEYKMVQEAGKCPRFKRMQKKSKLMSVNLALGSVGRKNIGNENAINSQRSLNLKLDQMLNGMASSERLLHVESKSTALKTKDSAHNPTLVTERALLSETYDEQTPIRPYDGNVPRIHRRNESQGALPTEKLSIQQYTAENDQSLHYRSIEDTRHEKMEQSGAIVIEKD